MFKRLSLKLNSFRSKKVIKNLLLVSFITLFINGLGFIKETVVASHFGLSLVLDTFFIAILIPGFISNVFIGAYKSVFIPNYILELKNGNNKGAFQTTSFIITMLICLVFIIIAYLATDIYLELLFPGKTESYYLLVKQQFYILLPCIFFWGFSSLISGLLYVDEEYKFSSFSGIFTPLSILSCIFFLSGVFGNMVLAWGTFIGSLLGLIFILTVALKKDLISLGKLDSKNKNIQMTFQQLPAKISSGVLTGLNSIVDQFFAAQLVVGSIAAINYGLKIPAFIVGLLVIAFSNVLLPYFTKAIIENKQKAYQTLFKTLKWVFLGVLVCSAIGIILSHDVVALLFERKEFTSEDTKKVATIQQIFLAYIPFTISGMIMVNFLTSINKNSIMAYISLAALILNIILDYILMQYYGIYGIALCTTIVVILKNIAMFIYLKKQKNNTA